MSAMPKQYWLMKSEPTTFSIDDLKRVKREPWDGVRNYQARNFMRDEMQIGDQAFFYHSNTEPPGIVGICEVVSESYPDPTQFDPKSKYFDPKSSEENPRWFLVDVKFVEKFPRLLSLAEIRANKKLQGMKLIQKGQRLSIQPVSLSEWKEISECLNAPVST